MRQRSITVEEMFADHRHILIAGISGSGKTDLVESIALDAFDSDKYKVIFFDFFKYECCQLGFPEARGMASLIRNKFFSEPKGYPHEVLLPFAVTTFDRKKGNKMLVQLPKHEDIDNAKAYTYWRPFKLAFSQLTVSDLFVVLRMLTEPGKVSLDFLHQMKEYNSIEDLIRVIVKLVSTSELRVGFEGEGMTAKIGKPEIYQAILRLLVSIQQSGFLGKSDNPYKLNLDEIMRSDRITTFSFANLDDDNFRFMVFVSILRQIKELRVKNSYDKELLLVLPELADVAPATNQISPAAVIGSYSALNIMQLFSRQSRILKITLLCDTQSPKDCNRTVRDNFGWVVLGAMQQNVLRWLNDNFVRIPTIPYFKIPHLQVGTYCIVPLDERYYCYPFFARPCLARHRRRGDDVRGWIAKQEGVELVGYEDTLQSPLRVSIGEKPVKGKKPMNLTKQIEAQLRKGKVTKKELSAELKCSVQTITNIFRNLDLQEEPTGKGRQKRYWL